MEKNPDLDVNETIDNFKTIIDIIKESITNDYLKAVRTNLFPIYFDFPKGEEVIQYYYGYIDGSLASLVEELEKFLVEVNPQNLKVSDLPELIDMTKGHMEEGIPTVLVMPWEDIPTTFILAPVRDTYVVTDAFVNGESLIQTAINKVKAKFPDTFADMPKTKFFS